MTVQELIDILQTLPKNKIVQAQDTNGNDTTDWSIWHIDDRVEILGMPDANKLTKT